MFDFVGRRRYAYLLSAFVFLASIIALVAPPRLPFGLEFTSGTSLTIEFDEPVDVEDVRAKLDSLDLQDSVVQETGDGTFFIRTPLVEEGLLAVLQESFGPVDSLSFERATDVATTVTFVATVTEADILAAFDEDTRGNVSARQVNPDQFFLFSTNLSEEEVSAAAEVWAQAFEVVDQTSFQEEGRLAEVVTFTDEPDANILQGFLIGFTIPGEGLVGLADGNTVTLGALQLSEERRQELFEALEQLGEFERAPFDFTTGQMLLLEASNQVSRASLIGELATPRVGMIVGGRAQVQRGGDALTLLIGGDLRNLQAQLVSDIGNVFGPADLQVFDGEDDLALTVSYGPAVTEEDVNNEIRSRALDDVFTSEVAANTFSIVSDTLDADSRAALVAGFEGVFGPLAETNFNEAGDLAISLEFASTVSLSGLRDAVEGFDGLAVFVTPLGGNDYAFTAKGLAEDRRQALADMLKSEFGEAEERLLPVDVGTAVNLDFGRVVGLNEMRQAAGELGPEDLVLGIIDDGFLLAGHAVSEEDRQALLDGLTQRFGPAAQEPFDFAQRFFFTLAFTDPSQVEAGVTDVFIVQEDGRSEFFIGANRLSEAQQTSVLVAMRDAFGQFIVSDFDFNDGVAAILTFQQPVSEGALQQRLADFGYENLVLERRGPDSWFMRSARPQDDQRSTILRALAELAPIDQESVEFSSVDAEIAKRSIVNTFWAVLAGTVGIMLYVWWAFRRIPKSFRYGLAAIVGLAHDVLFVLGVFGLLAKFTNVEINSLMIVGILAVIGYSVNNTIVVFDRIRENVAKAAGRDFETSVNVSLNETLTRNLNTSLTTLAALLAVFLFGGESIRDFMLVIAVGVVGGTYSSLFLAPNLVVSAERGELPRLRIPFFGRRRAASAR